MPPVASKLTEDDRIRVALWIDKRLLETACSTGPFAGAPAIRRLNRREYHNTIRDLLGIEFFEGRVSCPPHLFTHVR